MLIRIATDTVQGSNSAIPEATMNKDTGVKSLKSVLRTGWKSTARFRHQTKIRAIYHLFPTREKQPLFVLTRQRTGGNMMLGYLNSIPEVSMAHEFLNPKFYYGFVPRPNARDALMQHVRRSLNGLPGEICGCKILPGQFKKHGISLDDFHEVLPDAKYIVLYRREIFKQFVSLKIAHTTNQYVTNDKGNIKRAKIVVDLDELEAFYQVNNSEYESVINHPALQGRSCLVAYEDVAAHAQEVFDNDLFPFLGVPPVKIATSYVKQGKKSMAETVENYNEIEAVIGKYRFHEPAPLIKGV